jgi:dihydropteroate synthase
VPLAHGGSLRLGERTLVMGILNLSPDSFAERTRLDAARVLDAAIEMEAQGADLLDLGGESTRPGATAVSEADEIARVLPAIRALAGRVRIPLSIDTQKSSVARAAIDEGASLVNDVSGLQADAGMGPVVAAAGAGLVLMHSRGGFTNMYARAEYGDLMAEVIAELSARVAAAEACGVARRRVIVDPGIGFAKRPAHSYGVLAGLERLSAAFDLPVLVGPSRKSFMSEALDDRPAVERDWGTAAAVTAAVLSGAHIVRVHAVEPMVQVVRVAESIRRHGLA